MQRLLLLTSLFVLHLFGSNTVNLSWTASTSPDIAGYNIYRSRVATGCTEVPAYDCILMSSAGPVACCETADPSVIAGYTYYYWATAVDTSGDESADSVVAVAIIP